MNDLTVSKDATEQIKLWEGFRPHSYKCPSGIWTIGYGHTAGWITESTQISISQAQTYLYGDLLTAQRAVKQWATVSLTQGQFDALVSFVFNCGVNAFKHSHLLQLINTKQDPSEEFLKWSHDEKGDVLAGLYSRRTTEVRWWKNGG